MSKDIPAIAYIEQQILGHAASEGNLMGSARRVEAQYGLETGYFGSGLILQTRILSLLYVLILFPKEYWKMGQDDPIYQEIEERWSLNSIQIIVQDEKYGTSIYGFIHRLRNALAHANITLHEEYIELSDNWKGEEVYRARISNNEAEKFLSVVGCIMANRRNRKIQ